MTRPLKIAYVLGRFPMLSEPFILNQITGAVARGCDVRIFAVQGPPEAGAKIHPDFHRFKLEERTHYPPAPPADQSLRPAAAAAAIERLEGAAPTAAAALRRMSAGPKPAWKTILRGAAIAEHGPFDVIHCQFGFFAERMIALRDAGVTDAAVLTTFRGGDISRYVDEQGPEVYARTFADGDHFFANCGFFRDKAVAIGCPADRIEVHGSGIDLTRFAYQARRAPAEGPIRIATTGRLVEKKGVPYVIDAIALLRERGFDVHFHILGDGPMRDQLEAQIATLDMAEHITLHGWCDQREVIAHLDQCHLFVAASVTAENGDQDAPVNTLKEAMAMGLPVVASRHGGIPELVVDGVNGRLTPERDGVAIAEALGDLIQRRADWPAIGQAGRRSVEDQFDMTKLNDRLVAVYGELAERRTSTVEIAYANAV